MANGTVDEKIARADRIREMSARAALAAEQNRRGTQNAIHALRREPLESYGDENEISKVTAPGITAQLSLPWWARGAIGVALAALILAVAVAILRR